MGQLDDILKHQNMVRNNIMKSFGAETSEDSLEKSFEDEVNPFEMEAYKSELTKAELDEFEKAKHQDGDMHPNGKWVWRQSANGGKGDWRVAKPSRGGGSSKTTSSSSKKTSGDFDGLSSAKTQLEVNKFWSNLLTSNSGKGQNIAGKLLDSIKESGYRNLSGGMTVSGKEVYTYTNKDADKNIKILPAIDGVVIKTNDKREVLKVSDFKTVSDFKKKFEETVLGLSGDVSNAKKPDVSNEEKFADMDIKEAKKKLVGKNLTFKDYWSDGKGGSVDATGKITNVRLYGKNKQPVASVEFENGDSATVSLKQIDEGKAAGYDLSLSASDANKKDGVKSEKSSYESKEADAYDKGDGKVGNYPVPTHTSYPAANLYSRLKNNRHFGFKYGLPEEEIMKKLKDYKGNVKVSYHNNAGTSEIYRIKFL